MWHKLGQERDKEKDPMCKEREREYKLPKMSMLQVIYNFLKCEMLQVKKNGGSIQHKGTEL